MFDPDYPPFLPPMVIERVHFDEAAALAEAKELLAKRDVAKGEYKDAVLELGRLLLKARAAMPGERVGRFEKFSPAFLAFVAKTGLAVTAARNYMSFARDPRRLEAKRDVDNSRNRSAKGARRKALLEIMSAFENGYSREEILSAIRKELASADA